MYCSLFTRPPLQDAYEFNDLPLINKIVKLLKSEYYIIQITPQPELNEIDPVTVIGADDFTTIAK